MNDLNQAMAAVDQTDAEEAALKARSKVLADHRRHLPTLRKEALVRTFTKEIDALRDEVLTRQAETQAKMESIDEDETIATTMVMASIHEAEQARSDEMRRFDKQIEALRYDLKVERRKAAERRKIVTDAAEAEEASALNMLSMLERALGGET